MARVLIVDDSIDVLTLLQAFFRRRASHEVLIARNGEEGLHQALEHRPDLALVDIMMPGMDGYELIRRLRADPRTESMGILVLTARGQPVDQQAALQTGADAYLAKPVNLEELEAIVDKILSNRSQKAATVLPILSLKGGLGVTTTAVNLALLLQQQAPTALWDLAHASGHVALCLGIAPQTHWGAILQQPDMPVTSVIQEHTSRLQVLCAPPIPVTSQELGESQVHRILHALQETATYIVIDTPPILNAATLTVLRLAQEVILLTSHDPAGIQSTLATLQVLRDLRARSLVVHSRPIPSPSPDLDPLSRLMHTSIRMSLPYDPKQDRALRTGIPITLSAPDSALAKAYRQLLKLVTER